jgi:hypothetical protein
MVEIFMADRRLHHKRLDRKDGPFDLAALSDHHHAEPVGDHLPGPG